MNAGSNATRDALIESHRYLCRRIALRFLRRGLEVRDLEQVGAIGLIKASRRYDPSSQTPFEAYARVMILGELMHHVRDFEHAVRIPRWVRTLERRSASTHEALTMRLGREPSEPEIAAELGVSLGNMRELVRARNVMLTGACEETPPAAPAGATPEDRILANRALAELGPLERRIVLGVYALGLSQTEVARQLRLGTRQVYRMHRSALARMQHALATPLLNGAAP